MLEILKKLDQSEKPESPDRTAKAQVDAWKRDQFKNSRRGDFNQDLADPEFDRLFGAWFSRLDETRLRESNVTGPMHLVSLNRPIHVLARRAVTFDKAALVDGAEISNYSLVSHYHDALLLLCERTYTAIQASKITPRDDLLGDRITFPQAPEFKKWRRLYRFVMLRDKAAAMEVLRAPIADSADEVFPRVLVDPTEFSTWAEAEGIAVRGEMERLLGSEDIPSAVSCNSASGVNQQSSPNGVLVEEVWKVKAKQYANEIYRRDKAAKCEPSKSDIAAAVAQRFLKEGVESKRGRLDPQNILRNALADWQKPT